MTTKQDLINHYTDNGYTRSDDGESTIMKKSRWVGWYKVSEVMITNESISFGVNSIYDESFVDYYSSAKFENVKIKDGRVCVDLRK